MKSAMNPADEIDEAGTREVAVPSSVELIAAAEINQQIATAHRFPRSMAAFQKRAISMVSLDEDTAESCIYRRPVGKKRDEKGNWIAEFAEGMSIRMAEIVGACYGNLRVGAMIVSQSDRQVIARGVAHDLESNFASASEVVESTVGKDGRPYSERQRVVIAKAALSKARRDATFCVVPRALCRTIESQARKIAIGDATTLEKRRSAAMAWIAKIGVDPARVFAALGVEGEADIGLDQLETLTGLKTAIKDGETSKDEAFPPLDEQPKASGADAVREALRAKKQNGGDPPPPPAPPPADAEQGAPLPSDPPAPQEPAPPVGDAKLIETKLLDFTAAVEEAGTVGRIADLMTKAAAIPGMQQHEGYKRLANLAAERIAKLKKAAK